MSSWHQAAERFVDEAGEAGSGGHGLRRFEKAKPCSHDGRALRELGREAEARARLQEALQVFEDMGEQERRGRSPRGTPGVALASSGAAPPSRGVDSATADPGLGNGARARQREGRPGEAGQADRARQRGQRNLRLVTLAPAPARICPAPGDMSRKPERAQIILL